MAKSYIATETTLAQINAKIGSESIGGGASPHITVNAPSGCTVTATCGSTTLVSEEEGSTGTYFFNPPHLGTWNVTVSKDGRSHTTSVKAHEVKEYTLNTAPAVRYGYRIKKDESDPYTRVEYLYDAVGMEPAYMNYASGQFDYGDWGNVWFVTGNKPLMLKYDSTVDYYLNPNDYSQKEDGTASDITNTGYAGNAMASFPLGYIKRYEQDGYEYEILSNVKFDEDYEAYAHTRADGTIADVFYWSMFRGSGSASQIRSLSGKSLAANLTAAQEIAGCQANGTSWYTHTWSQREYIRTLLVLMGKSTDTQTVFGNGNCRSGSEGSVIASGTLNTRGQFFGFTSNTDRVKVFHVEDFWGNQWDRTAGVINNSGPIFVKMTPEGDGYRVTDVVGYENTGVTLTGTSGGYISSTRCGKFGIIPATITGSGTTYYCDCGYFNNGQMNYLIAGASSNDASLLGGAFCFNVNNLASSANWYFGCGLSTRRRI